MAILKILSGDSAGATIPIGDGNHRVGRADTNHVRIVDGSVSGAHCEIELDNAGNLLIRDLGSTNGTFIEGNRVHQARVQPGQRLRLGTLELQFDNPLAKPSPPPAPLPPPPAPVVVNLPPPPIPVAPLMPVAQPRTTVVAAAAPMPVTPANGGDICAYHPTATAIAVCGRCGTKACGDCTKKQKVGRNIVHFCPACGGSCKNLGDIAKAAAIDAQRVKTFGAAVKRAISYPFSGNGIILLACGTIFFGLLNLLRGFGIYYLVLRVIFWGYMFAFMQRVVVTSAAGEEEPPDFPEVTDIGSDIIQPFCQLLATLGVSLAPAIIGWIYLGPLPGQALLLFGMVFFPMSLLGVAMSDSYSALNPVFVLSSIMKIPGSYLLTCIVFAVLGVLYSQVQEAMFANMPFLLAAFIFWAIFLFFSMVGMRILGMLYYLNKQKLGWGL